MLEPEVAHHLWSSRQQGVCRVPAGIHSSGLHGQLGVPDADPEMVEETLESFHRFDLEAHTLAEILAAGAAATAAEEEADGFEYEEESDESEEESDEFEE